MDLQSVTRDLDKLATADVVAADSYVRYLLRKAALYFLAILLAIVGIGLLLLALYWLLSDSLGKIGAVALLGLLGCVIAGIVAAIALLQRPARDFSVAIEMRRSALATLEQNVGSSLNPSAYLYPAGEALLSSVLLPLLGILIRSLKSSDRVAIEKAPPEPSKSADASLVIDTPKG